MSQATSECPKAWRSLYSCLDIAIYDWIDPIESEHEQFTYSPTS
ncbi:MULTISPECIES: hypothetical protein [Pseudanabaena]|uniref:Uncharacterized protein n=1 Tax=Pseudanabaena catenata USMAC16 TaxID=1855837 RepID=A0A9X4MK14_9CYAN|nr:MULTISPECIES: hypothetical protein [Pseudanabaena]MDG3497364.1 hypothetical protein [Pseudanabaena catenata USMAC16]